MMQIKLIELKKIVVLLAFLGFITLGHSQTKKVRMGFTFDNGLSFMTSDNTNVANTKAGYAFAYGVPVEIRLSENYSLGTGFNVSHLRASRTNSPSIDSIFTMDAANGTTFAFDNLIVPGAIEAYKFTYVNLPITFKMKTNAMGYFRYFGEFGISNGIRVRARLNLKGSKLENESITEKNDLNIRSTFYNASLKVGGGFEYTISDKTALLVGLFFQNGFVNILNDGPDNDRTVMRYLSLTTGIMF